MKKYDDKNTQVNKSSYNDLCWRELFLTPLEMEDVNLLYIWQNAPYIRDLTMGFRFPVQKNAVTDWIQDSKDRKSKSRIIFAVRRKSDLIGIVSLNFINTYQRKAQFGIYIGNQAERSKNYGFVAASLLLDYAFNGLDLRRISLDVVSENLNAIALYEKLGFVREGQNREDYFADGRYIDTYTYGILKREFIINIPVTANRLLYSF